MVRDHIGGPVKGVTAIVDGTAALWLLVDGAEKLPLRCSHLGTCVGAARRCVKEEADDERVALRYEEAAELVEPQRSIDTRRGLR